MPGYQSGQAKLLRTNSQIFLLNSETLGVGFSTAAVQLDRISHSYYPWGVSVEVFFPSAPGTFELDVQTSDTDVDSHYVLAATTNKITAVNAGFVARLELTQFWAKFLRVNNVALGNAIPFSVLVTR